MPPTKRPKTTHTKSKTQSTRHKKPNKKTNNMPIIVGVAFAVVVLIVIIIASNQSPSGNSQYTDQFLTSEQKNAIYNEYVTTCAKIEKENMDGLNSLSPADRSRAEAMIRKKIHNLKSAAINKLQGKWEKQIPNLPADYIRNNVIKES